MTRLRLLNYPFRRELTVRRRAERTAANAARPPGVKLDFRCRCRAGMCPGHVDVDDDALARFVVNAGYCAIVESADDAWRRQVAATSQLKVLELSGSGQTLQNQVVTKITCFTTVIRNTLETSTWDGQNFTIGAGEDGLWSF